jgi:PPK2 family polyphosphate:nucleotide phosphotransferase
VPLTFSVAPGSAVALADYDARHDDGLTRKDAEARRSALVKEIDELQDLLYAASTHALLVVLQGMDTSGKDGTIRKVFGPVDPLGVRAVPFGPPNERELSHDFLWRVHRAAPAKGEVAIFNRSHYEDVLIVRVHGLVPEAAWQARYAHINAFEKLLADSDTIILKFFLHISHDEQKKRLLAREKEVAKAWKLSAGDWEERKLWDDYQRAYEDALSRCSTDHAPWEIVPADRKWFRNLAVASRVAEALRPLKAGWLESLAQRGETALAEIAAIRKV